MKKLFTLMTITAFAVGLPAGLSAAEKKAPAEKPADAGKAPAKPAEAAKPAPEKVAGAAKPIPMHAEVSTIDAAGKSFTHKNKDGKEVKFTATATTEIKNGEAAAKFEDIKVGDYVSGLRTKKSDTEYEIVKITKFGAKAEKKAEGDKKPDAAKKPEEKKKS